MKESMKESLKEILLGDWGTRQQTPHPAPRNEFVGGCCNHIVPLQPEM
jgi:hypothetical protein